MKYTFFIALLIFSGCSEPKKKKTRSYEDLKGFFDSEAQRLTTADPEIKKTVARNDNSETRLIRNIDWNIELSLFAESDINKPAWQSSYKIINQAGKTVYRATEPDLKTREISINKDPLGKITKVRIINHTKNLLYSSEEQLLYIPDSLYQISKQQHVVVIGENRYFINGVLNR